MAKQSAGIAMYRWQEGNLQVLLAHPGGPFWAKKDLGAWSFPKGEFSIEEEPLEAAGREFAEETGFAVDGPYISLGHLKQTSGKIVHIWALESDLDPTKIRSNRFLLEWPAGSGKIAEFPEIDRVEWFSLEEAKKKILAGQAPFLDRLQEELKL